MPRVDLNCDLGEGGAHDAELMPLITSANIACGAHAGDESMMRATIALAQRHGVAIGAHPGFADRDNFGRKELVVTPRQAAELVRAQLRGFQEISAQLGAEMHHVKLHGALYNMVSRDRDLAEAVVEAVQGAHNGAIFYVLAGSELERVARAKSDLVVVSEVFADRTYQADGTLTPRSRPDALIQDGDVAVAQVLRMVREGRVRATDGSEVKIKADTICLHGDGADPVAFACRVSSALRAAGIELRRPGG